MKLIFILLCFSLLLSACMVPIPPAGEASMNVVKQKPKKIHFQGFDSADKKSDAHLLNYQ